MLGDIHAADKASLHLDGSSSSPQTGQALTTMKCPWNVRFTKFWSPNFLYMLFTIAYCQY